SITQFNGVTEESDLASLQQLSTGFESFNQVINDNIARAKTIIQEAAAARAKATEDIADERARFEQEMADARAAFGAEAATEQARLDGQRAQLLAAAQAVVNNEWPEPVTPPAPVAVAAAPARVEAVAAPVVETIAAEVIEKAPAEPAAESIAAEVAEAAEPVEAAAPAAASEPAVVSEPAAVAEAPVSTEPTRTTVIVHGIHKPAVATGLQRFLLGQPGISGVEPREFAEGILRLQVRGTVPISEGLFEGWSDGEGMTVIQRVPQTVEVILPTAS
ncbi:MAG: hypothetical protein ACRDHN_02970, partial [Thermomicrobiales bacterium]